MRMVSPSLGVVDRLSFDPCLVAKATYKEVSVRCKEMDSTSSVGLSQEADQQLDSVLQRTRCREWKDLACLALNA